MELIRFSCPSCQLLLQLGEILAGRQVKCPRCSTTVLVPTASGADPAEAGLHQYPALTPAPQPVSSSPSTPGNRLAFGDYVGAAAPSYGTEGIGDDDGGPVTVSAEEVAGWTAVCKGLRLFSSGLAIFTVAVVARVALVALAVMVAVTQRSRFSSDDIEIINCCDSLIGIGILVSWTSALVGLIFALQIPTSSRCKPFLVTALSCVGVASACLLLTLFIQVKSLTDGHAPRSEGTSALAIAFGMLVLGCWITATVMLLLFLHKIGTLLQSAALRKQVWRFATIWGIGAGAIIVCYAAGAGVIGASMADGRRFPGSGALVMVALIGLVALAAYFVVLGMYSRLLGLARIEIDNRIVNPANA